MVAVPSRRGAMQILAALAVGGGGPPPGGLVLPSDIRYAADWTPRDPVIQFVGRGENATRVVPFAITFPKGWVPAGTPLCLRTTSGTAGGVASGTQLRTQIDIHHTHDDGSARMVLVAGEIPPLGLDEMLTCLLKRGEAHPDPGPTLSWATLASGKSVTATMGSATGIDMLGGVGAGYWRQGPLVLERRYQADTVARGLSNGSGWAATNGGDYGLLGAASMAELRDLFPTRTYIQDQWDYLTGPAIAEGLAFFDPLNPNHISSAPHENVVPRGFTRAS